MNCENCGTEMVRQRENYRYIESGLNTVTLEDIEVRTCRRCGAREAVIPRMAELHRVLPEQVHRVLQQRHGSARTARNGGGPDGEPHSPRRSICAVRQEAAHTQEK